MLCIWVVMFMLVGGNVMHMDGNVMHMDGNVYVCGALRHSLSNTHTKSNNNNINNSGNLYSAHFPCGVEAQGTLQ